MDVQVTIPGEIFNSDTTDVSREVIETIAAEGFRSGQLGTAQVRRLLGFATRSEVHQFLAERGIPWVNYSVEDARKESEALRKLLGR